MQTVTTEDGAVHPLKTQRQLDGSWQTQCNRIRVGNGLGMFYNVDDEPKTPTCLWCAAAEYRR